MSGIFLQFLISIVITGRKRYPDAARSGAWISWPNMVSWRLERTTIFDCYTDGRTLDGEPMPQAKTTQRHRSSTANRYWSANVTRDSDALDLKPDVFTWHDPKRIARSLKTSAEASKRRKVNPYQSPMSMLSFYVNRRGRTFRGN
jgi:Protein of unknown function (DUF3175)